MSLMPIEEHLKLVAHKRKLDAIDQLKNAVVEAAKEWEASYSEVAPVEIEQFLPALERRREVHDNLLTAVRALKEAEK